MREKVLSSCEGLVTACAAARPWEEQQSMWSMPDVLKGSEKNERLQNSKILVRDFQGVAACKITQRQPARELYSVACFVLFPEDCQQLAECSGAWSF